MTETVLFYAALALLALLCCFQDDASRPCLELRRVQRWPRPCRWCCRQRVRFASDDALRMAETIMGESMKCGHRDLQLTWAWTIGWSIGPGWAQRPRVLAAHVLGAQS